MRTDLSPRRSTTALAAVAIVAATMLPLSASALAIVGGLQQISFGDANGFGPSLSADGSRMAFFSAGNLTGDNADRNFEIFTYESTGFQLRQITNLGGGIAAGGNQGARISGDGSRVVYQQFFPDGGFVDFQTLTRNLATSAVSAVTPRGDFSEQAVINRDGSRIAVQTDNTGVRLFDTGTGTLGGVAVAGNGLTMSISGDGSRLVRAAFDGSVVMVDLATSAVTPVAPAGAGINLRPDISDDGRYIVFSATFNPLGSNPDGNAELFLFDTQTSLLRQLTQTTSGSNGGASISGDGSRIAFSSSSDPLGTNADGSSEIFVLDLVEVALLQVTNRPAGAFGSSQEAELSTDGRWLAFSSFANLTGSNAGGASNIFLANLSVQRDTAVPLPGTAWLLLAAISVGLATRRRRAPRMAG
jgi:Tol biopolymer transport system component